MNEALDLMHALVLENGRRWGEAAHDFQRIDGLRPTRAVVLLTREAEAHLDRQA
jgi:hypothetical protein